ncbi:MAG: aspartate--tRNA ligase [Deltaproteobacteria bacterium]|nr:aspartate--tRNA ligase [Deltaproteobacteria bacterium]
MKWKKRTYCGELATSDRKKNVLLMGWVDAIRDHGNILFIHLRDVSGIVQVVFSSEEAGKIYENATVIREEYIVKVTGRVCLREKGTENPNLSTGEIEVMAESLEILSTSKTLPFQISEKAMVLGDEILSSPENVDEELRLRYRYLDLRRPSMQELFKKRYEIIKCIRQYLDELNFIEVETPFLTRSTPEGARDYLVPSRVHQGKFYALPQSPQLFKQLLMISGMDRYFQIARCFRDEDLRPNRQPEFTQLDLEASFIDEDFIYEMIEELTVRMFAIGGIELPRPFPRMTYHEAMDRYGSDRPDLRFGMAFKEVSDIVKDTGYSIFRQIIGNGGLIKGFCVKGQAEALSKNILQNEYAMKIVPAFGAKGMTWMKIVDNKLQSNIVQFFTQKEQESLIKYFKAEDGDVLMMIADTDHKLVNEVLNRLRLHVAGRLNLIPEERFYPLWVTDFPLFEIKDDRLSSQHHPFTMPDKTDFDSTNMDEMLKINSRAYDLVVNGEELGGGSIRIHKTDIQKKIFQALGLSKEEAEAKFGFFLKALEFGAPPHAGLALGIDRVVSMILRTSSIRDVIAFPKNRRAFCPLTKAPSFADHAQLEELCITGSETTFFSEGTVDTDLKISPRAAKKAEMISRDEVNHVAKLARLRLTDTEIDMFQKDLNSILEYVEELGELNTDDISPMSHVLDVKNVWREDTQTENKETEPLIANAPMREKAYFKVPKILEG